MDLDINKWKMALSTAIPSTFDEKYLVNFSPPITTVRARMLTHPRSTLCILCRLMQLRLCHVMLLRTLEDFNPFNFPPVGLKVPGSLLLGSAPNFQVV